MIDYTGLNSPYALLSYLNDLEKEQKRIAKEQERQAKELARHEKRIADLELKMSQAEFDIADEEEKLEHYSQKLLKLDADLKHAEWEIKSWKDQRHIANVAKAEKKKEKIADSIFSMEGKVRASEKKLARARFTLETAKKVVREIIGWKWHDDDVKHYFIKSFLLHWTTAEYIHEMTERDIRNSELRTA